MWERLHELLLAELHAADQLEWERAIADYTALGFKPPHDPGPRSETDLVDDDPSMPDALESARLCSSAGSPNTSRSPCRLAAGAASTLVQGRLDAMESFVNDAKSRGGTIQTGGSRHGNQGFFVEPTVITDVPDDSKIMTEEPFGPLAPIVAFKTFDEVVERANSLQFGLAAYAFTS